MKQILIISCSYSSYQDLVGETIAVIPVSGRYLPVSQIDCKNPFFISPEDATITNEDYHV